MQQQLPRASGWPPSTAPSSTSSRRQAIARSPPRRRTARFPGTTIVTSSPTGSWRVSLSAIRSCRIGTSSSRRPNRSPPSTWAWVQARRLETARRFRASTCSAPIARCHAIDETSQSPEPKAPAFREVVKRYDPDALEEALAEGIVMGHERCRSSPSGPARSPQSLLIWER